MRHTRRCFSIADAVRLVFDVERRPKLFSSPSQTVSLRANAPTPRNLTSASIQRQPLPFRKVKDEQAWDDGFIKKTDPVWHREERNVRRRADADRTWGEPEVLQERNPTERNSRTSPRGFGSESNADTLTRKSDGGRVYLRRPDGPLDVYLYSRVASMRQRDRDGKYLDFIDELAPPNEAEGRLYPVVQLKSFADAKEEELERKRQKKLHKVLEKRIEIGWSVEGKDLSHRLQKMQGFLQKGALVEFLIGSRRLKGWKQKKEMDEEECRALLSKIRNAAMEVPGAKEPLSPTGKVLDQVMLVFKGPRGGVTGSAKEAEANNDSPDTHTEANVIKLKKYPS